MLPGFPFFGFLFASVILLVSGAQGASTPPPWLYDFRSGDHLVYRYAFQRQSKGEDEFQVEAQFKTHVLVASASGGRIHLGFQRNRESAELTEFRSKGKDRLARERVEFQKRMQKRPLHFSEAQELSLTGEPRYPWEMARETSNHLLDAFHEVMNLPPMVLARGEAWRGSTLLGLDLRWVDDESIHGKLCHHVEGSLPRSAVKVSYWWSPESGVLEQLALDGTYPSPGGQVHETARMELESRSRDESLDAWLASADTRGGALQAILLAPEVKLSTTQLSPLLASGDSTLQALALALAARRGLELDAATLSTLRQSASERVRLLAEAKSDSEKEQPQVDPCQRPLPKKQAAEKFGTIFELTQDNSEIPYLFRVPLTYREDRPSPLLVYLSGGPGLAIDAVNTAEDAVADTAYLVLYPQAEGMWWTPESARRFDLVLQDVLRRFNVDRDRVYLTGFSNGGTGSLYFATFWPHRFAAVVTEMGAGQCNEAVKAGLRDVGNLPLLLIHGENDPIITPDCSTQTHAALLERRPAIKPELKILPKRGHDITLQSDDGLTLAFFKDKVRNPFPREVELSLPDALASRGYWIEIVNGKPGQSGVEGRVKSDNTIEIHSHDVKSVRLYLSQRLLSRPGEVRIVWNGKKMFTGPLADACSKPPGPDADPKLDFADTRELTLP